MLDNIKEARLIISDLYKEFLEEEKRLNDICNNHSIRIDELEQKISNYRRNDDVDFKVFSPRNVSSINNEKIEELENEKNNLEKESSDASKQLKYYSEKVVKLEKLLFLIDNNELSDNFYNSSKDDIFDFNTVSESADNENKEDESFDSLFPLRNHDNELVNNVDETDNNTDLSSDNFSEDLTNNISISDDSHDEDILDKDDEVEKEYKKYITAGSIAHILHKVEFTTKIISNDSIRAKIELKEIIKMLKDLINL